MVADIVIRGGTVIDGTGSAGRRADIAIVDQRIAAIGTGLDGREIIDAEGQVVCPGFIDIHTHFDAQIFWDPALTPSCYHGVTTVIAGNCGFSIAPTRPRHRHVIAETLEHVEDMSLASLEAGIEWDFETFPEYLSAVANRHPLLNFAAYIGHTPLRLYVMGDAGYERQATEDEIGRMERLVTEAMEAGAVGFSTSFGDSQVGSGGRPVPSRHAARTEFERLARIAGQSRQGVVTVNMGSVIPVEDLYDLQKQWGVPVTYVALVSHPSGLHEKQLAAHRLGLARGGDVWPQISPLAISHDFLMSKPSIFNYNPLFAKAAVLPIEEMRAVYADPAWRSKALASFPTTPPFSPRWTTYRINESPAHPEMEHRYVKDIAAERGVTWLDVMLDLALDERDLGLRVLAAQANDDAEAVTRLLNEEHCTIGLSDAGAHLSQHCEAMQPTAFLGTWVRDRRVMSLEKAVRMLTGAQSDLLGLKDRGYLRKGAWADIVVFDPDTIGPGPIRRVGDFPANGKRLTADQPSGMTHILVNGVPIRTKGKQRDILAADRPGHMVRFSAR